LIAIVFSLLFYLYTRKRGWYSFRTRWAKVGKFFGTYNRTLDEKHRLQIPSKLVKEMPKSFYVLRGFDGCLAVYEESSFEALLAKLENLQFNEKTSRDYIRLASSSAVELEVDAHGRVTITSDLASTYHIEGEVSIIGVIDHFEIWDKATYEDYIKEKTPSYEEFASESVKL
jgi:MraZ protein